MSAFIASEPGTVDAQAHELLSRAWRALFADPALCLALVQQAQMRATQAQDAQALAVARAMLLLPAVRAGPNDATAKAVYQLHDELLGQGLLRGAWLCEDLLAEVDTFHRRPDAARRYLQSNAGRPADQRSPFERGYTLMLLMWVEHHDNAFEAALEAAYELRSLARQVAEPVLEGVAMMEVIAAHGVVMDFSSILPLQQPTRATLLQGGARLLLRRFHANSIYLDYGCGQPQRAARTLRNWLDDVGLPEAPAQRAGSYDVPLALGLMASGDLEAAAQRLTAQPPQEWVDGQQRAAWHWAWGWLLLARGQAQQAIEICRRYLDGSDRSQSDTPFNLVQLHEVLRQACETLGDYRGALEAAKAVRQVELPLLPLHARVRYLSQQMQWQAEGGRRDAQCEQQHLQRLNDTVQAHLNDWNLSITPPAPPAQFRRYVAHVSHELRTPLSGVIGLTDILLRSPLDDRQRRLVELARSSAQNMVHLVGDIIDLSRLEAGQMQLESSAFSLADLVQETAALLRPMAQQRSLRLEHWVDPSLPAHLLGDRLRLRQVLTNLLGNAVKFTPAGEVSLSVHRLGDGDSVPLRIEVADTGPGIEPGLRGRLFTEFAQGQPPRGLNAPRGSGLGLAITRQLIGAMGGRIGVDDRPYGGSIFWVELRLAACATERLADLGSTQATPASTLSATRGPSGAY